MSGAPARWIIHGAHRAAVRAQLYAHVVAVARRHTGSTRAALGFVRHLVRLPRVGRGAPLPRKMVEVGERHFSTGGLPGFPSRAFDRFVEGEIDRWRAPGSPAPLQLVVFAVTRLCPLRCSHCSERGLLGNVESLSLADLEGTLAKLLRRGVGQLQLSGGEPLQRLDAVEILARQAAPTTDVWILTCGVGLDRAAAERLARAGVTGVNVSLDHWDPAHHDAFRHRPGTFREATAGLGHAREAGLATAVTFTATRETATEDTLWRLLDLASSLGVGFVRVLEPRSVGQWADEDVALRSEHVAALERVFLEANDRHPELPIVDYPGYGQRRAGCFGAGDRYLFIDATGAVHACPFCRTPAGDAVREDLETAMARLRVRACHAFAPASPARAAS